MMAGKGRGTIPLGSLDRPVGYVERLDTCIRSALLPRLRSRHTKKSRIMSTPRQVPKPLLSLRYM